MLLEGLDLVEKLVTNALFGQQLPYGVFIYPFITAILQLVYSRDSIVVSTSRCGRENPGSNPGHGRVQALHGNAAKIFLLFHPSFRTLNHLLKGNFPLNRP